MKKLLSLKINYSGDEIAIYVPNTKKKINYYYEPTKKLHKFDEVLVIYLKGKNETLLMRDVIQEILTRLSGDATRALANQLQIPLSAIDPRGLGAQYNIDMYKKKRTLPYSDYAVFFADDTQTWIYNLNNKIFFEISPVYRWLHIEPESIDTFISFEDFMRGYKAYQIFEVDRKDIEKLKKKCDLLIKKLDIK